MKTGLAKKRTLLHLPLPLWLVAFIRDLFAAYSAYVGRLLLPKHELSCLFDVAVPTEQAFDPPVFARFVFVTPELLATYGAIHDLLFTENMQAKTTCLYGYKNICRRHCDLDQQRLDPPTSMSGSGGKMVSKFDSSPDLNPLFAPGESFCHTFEAGDYTYYA